MEKEKPDWLIDIQNKSWEPELFISGSAIFFLLQLTNFIHRKSFLMLQETGFKEPLIIADYLITAFNILIFGFILHLSFRGFWVASVCLSYVFPKGIRQDKMNYAKPFQKLQEIRDTVDLVILLETLCSLIFSLSFLFFTLIIGVLFSLLIIVPHSSLEASIGTTGFQVLQIASYMIMGLGGIYLLDFITLGYLKKQKAIARFYYPVYWFFSILTFAPFYRTIYYTLITNIKPWQVLLTITLYIGVGFGITRLNREQVLLSDINTHLRLSSDENKHELRYYEAQRPQEVLVNQASIQSEIIEENYLRLFIVHQKAIERTMLKECQTKDNETHLNCCANFYNVYIDNQLQDSINWRQYEHPKTGEKGIISFIPIKELTANQHKLKIILNVSSVKDLQSLKDFGMDGATFAVIPFWKN